MSKHDVEANKPCSCDYCHRTFYAVRWNARFCSVRCRVAYKRFLDSVNVVEHDMDRLIDKLSAYYHTDCQGAASHAARKAANRLRYLAEKLEDE